MQATREEFVGEDLHQRRPPSATGDGGRYQSNNSRSPCAFLTSCSWSVNSSRFLESLPSQLALSHMSRGSRDRTWVVNRLLDAQH